MTGETVARLFGVGSSRAGTMICRDADLLLFTGDVSRTTGDAAVSALASDRGAARFTPRVITVGPVAAAFRGCITVETAGVVPTAALSCLDGTTVAVTGTSRVGVVDTDTDAICTERKEGVDVGTYVSCCGGG